MFEKTGYCRATTTRLCAYKEKLFNESSTEWKDWKTEVWWVTLVVFVHWLGVCCSSLSLSGHMLCSSMETNMIVRKTRSRRHFKLICHILSPTLCCCSYYFPCYSLMDPLSRVYAPTAFTVHCFFQNVLYNSNPKEVNMVWLKMNNYSNT